MQSKGLVAPRPVKSSQIRDLTSVPCIDMWIHNHWITRETLNDSFFISIFPLSNLENSHSTSILIMVNLITFHLMF